MAKKTRVLGAQKALPPAGGALGDFAEDVGALFGRTEKRASEWLEQRKVVIQQLTAFRDKADDLLKQLGSLIPSVSLLGIRKKRGRPKKTSGSAVPPAVKATAVSGAKRRVMSAEGRARIAEAQRARWAKLKAAKRSGK